MMTFDQGWAIVEKHIDGYGLPCHFDMSKKPPILNDGGDTTQRLGMLAYALADLNANRTRLWFKAQLGRLECGLGRYRRHVAEGLWTHDEWIMSRDQSVALVIAMGRLGLVRELARFTLGYILRLGFATNLHRNHGAPGLKVPDHMTFPHFWGMFLRAWVDAIPALAVVAYPLLLVLDLVWPLASFLAVLKGQNDPHHSDDLNQILKLLQAEDVCPTPWSWLAQVLYSRWRTAPAGQTGWGPEACLRHYFKAPGAIRLDELYIKSGILTRLQG